MSVQEEIVHLRYFNCCSRLSVHENVEFEFVWGEAFTLAKFKAYERKEKYVFAPYEHLGHFEYAACSSQSAILSTVTSADTIAKQNEDFLMFCIGVSC